MKKLLFLLLPVYCFGQTYTSVDPVTKDTTVIEVKGVSAILKVPMITYKDSSYTYYGTNVTVKKYKPTETSTGTTTAFTGQIIPYSDADLIAPGRGAEHWGGHIWDDVDAVKVPAGITQGLDYYYRFNWRDFETTQKGVYNWTEFDRQMNYCITNGKKLNFGVMTLDGSVYKAPTVGGAYLTYPDWLHNAMQSEYYKDWIGAGLWIPNWNSNYYLSALEALNKAIANHINTTSYNGKLYKNAVGYIDVRGYGNFGEWHNWPYSGSTPTGRVATVSTLKRIVDSHTSAFPDHPLVAMSDGFATWGSAATPPEVVTYLLTTRNAWGLLGWRRDNWGNPEYSDRLENNPVSGAAALIMERWKYAPIVGETWTGNADVSANGSQAPYYDLERQIKLYHAASFGNGNYQRPLTDAMRNNIRNSSKASGYRLQVVSGSITTGTNGKISVTWSNVGVAPTYENWTTVFELKSGSTVVWKGESSFKAKMFLPGTLKVGDTYASIPDGSYTLTVKLIDPTGYRQPLVLANRNRNSDGSYTLK